MSELVYRISTAKEWEELQSTGSSFGGDLDKSSAFIHLSKLDQVKFSCFGNFIFFRFSYLFIMVIGIGCVRAYIIVPTDLVVYGIRMLLWGCDLWSSTSSEFLLKDVRVMMMLILLQVRSTLENFFLNSKEELYLLQIDAKKVCNHFSMLFNGLGFDCDSWKN